MLNVLAMRKNNTPRKLQLDAQTLRSLTPETLATINGGIARSWTCGSSTVEDTHCSYADCDGLTSKYC